MSIESAHDLFVINVGVNRCCIARDAVGQRHSIVMSTAPYTANPEERKFTTYRQCPERMLQKFGEAILINGYPWIGHSRLLVAIWARVNLEERIVIAAIQFLVVKHARRSVSWCGKMAMSILGRMLHCGYPHIDGHERAARTQKCTD